MGGRVIKIKRTLCIKTLKNIFEMVQLSNEPRVFVVETYFRTNSYKKVKEAFSDKFPEKAVPSKSTKEKV